MEKNIFYDFKGVSLTPALGVKIINTYFKYLTPLQSKNPVSTELINLTITKFHIEHGGKAAENTRFLSRFLIMLKKLGIVSEVRRSYYKFNVNKSENTRVKKIQVAIPKKASNIPVFKKIIGEGKNAVYVYYYKHEKKGKRWPCKIGRSINHSDRVKRPAHVHQELIYALLIKTDQEKLVESILQQLLEFRGHKMILNDKKNHEWFNTNPNEVEKTYNEYVK